MMRWTASPREPVSRSVPWSSAGTISGGALRRRGDLVELLGRRRAGRVPHTRDEQLVRGHPLEQGGVRRSVPRSTRAPRGSRPPPGPIPLAPPRRARRFLPCSRPTSATRRRPFGPDEVHRAEHVLPDRRDLEIALRASSIAAGAIPAEVVREHEVPLVGETVREREPRPLIVGSHVREHDGRRPVAEQTALEHDAIAGLERDGPRAREIRRPLDRRTPRGRSRRARPPRADGPRTGPSRAATGLLAALLATLPAGLLQQLLVFLLPHLLAAFLDQRRHAAISYSDPNRFRRSTRLARYDASRRTDPSLSAFGPSATGEISLSTPSSGACSR